MQSTVTQSPRRGLKHRATVVAQAAQTAVSLLCQEFAPKSRHRQVLRSFEGLEARIMFDTNVDLELLPVGPLGGRIFGANMTDSNAGGGEVDDFNVTVAGGQKLGVAITPTASSTLRAHVQIINSVTAAVVADVTASADGKPVAVQPTTVPAGTYILRVQAS